MFEVYEDDVGLWHAEEIENGAPTGFVIGPFETEQAARQAADNI